MLPILLIARPLVLRKRSFLPLPCLFLLLLLLLLCLAVYPSDRQPPPKITSKNFVYKVLTFSSSGAVSLSRELDPLFRSEVRKPPIRIGRREPRGRIEHLAGLGAAVGRSDTASLR